MTQQANTAATALFSIITLFSQEKEKTMFPLVNFFSGINEKKNLELIMLTCEHNNRENPPNI